MLAAFVLGFLAVVLAVACATVEDHPPPEPDPPGIKCTRERYGDDGHKRRVCYEVQP